jgi:hypothetical protein
MKSPIIVRTYRSLADANLEAFARSVISSMTGNAYFPTPTPSITDLVTATDAFEAALAVATTGTPFNKAEKNEKKKDLLQVLDDLTLYIMFTAKFNAIILASTGFKISQVQPTPSPDPTKPQNLRVRLGDMPGQLFLDWDRGLGAKMFMYQYAVGTLNESTQWITPQVGTRCSYLFTGLPSGQRVWLRVLVIGAEGQEVASDPVSMIVQ